MKKFNNVVLDADYLFKYDDLNSEIIISDRKIWKYIVKLLNSRGYRVDIVTPRSNHGSVAAKNLSSLNRLGYEFIDGSYKVTYLGHRILSTCYASYTNTLWPSSDNMSLFPNADLYLLRKSGSLIPRWFVGLVFALTHKC